MFESFDWKNANELDNRILGRVVEDGDIQYWVLLYYYSALQLWSYFLHTIHYVRATSKYYWNIFYFIKINPPYWFPKLSRSRDHPGSTWTDYDLRVKNKQSGFIYALNSFILTIFQSTFSAQVRHVYAQSTGNNFLQRTIPTLLRSHCEGENIQSLSCNLPRGKDFVFFSSHF